MEGLRQDGEKEVTQQFAYGWTLCEECKDPVRMDFIQRDEEGRALCPVCFVKDAEPWEYTMPDDPPFKARYR